MMEKFSLQFRDRSVQSLLQRGESKFVQLSLDPGKGLTKHRAPLALTVVVLTGSVLFSVGEESVRLEASEMLNIDPSVEHAIEAIDKSTVLLILTPDVAHKEQSTSELGRTMPLEHENAYLHPELIEKIAVELRPLVADHVALCKTLDLTLRTLDEATIRTALKTIKSELNSHFVAEEKVVFPSMAVHVGGLDIGPVARLMEEHEHIRHLYKESESLMTAFEENGDTHAWTLLQGKVAELCNILLNHIGKEDSHLFPMASRLLTDEEKSAIAIQLR